MGIGTHLDSPGNSASNPNIRRNSRNMSVKVGEIQGHDVIYVPEKDVIFCKNTTLSFPLIERIIVKSSMDRTNIPEKELVIIKNNNTIHLGCLTTTMENCLQIRKQVNKLKL